MVLLPVVRIADGMSQASVFADDVDLLGSDDELPDHSADFARKQG